MAVITQTEAYRVEARQVGTLVTRLGDGATLYLQMGDDEATFLDSVFGVHEPADMADKDVDEAIDAYSELFRVEE